MASLVRKKCVVDGLRLSCGMKLKMSHEAVTKVDATDAIYLGCHANIAIFQGTLVSLAPPVVKLG